MCVSHRHTPLVWCVFQAAETRVFSISTFLAIEHGLQNVHVCDTEHIFVTSSVPFYVHCALTRDDALVDVSHIFNFFWFVCVLHATWLCCERLGNRFLEDNPEWGEKLPTHYTYLATLRPDRRYQILQQIEQTFFFPFDCVWISRSPKRWRHGRQ